MTSPQKQQTAPSDRLTSTESRSYYQNHRYPTNSVYGNGQGLPSSYSSPSRAYSVIPASPPTAGQPRSLREREIALREREIALREREVELNHKLNLERSHCVFIFSIILVLNIFQASIILCCLLLNKWIYVSFHAAVFTIILLNILNCIFIIAFMKNKPFIEPAQFVSMLSESLQKM